MIISIMNASGSALPSEQFAKKARPDLIRPHASPLKMRLNYETAAFSHAARLEPAHQHATAPALLPAWRAINLDRSAQRSSDGDGPTSCALLESALPEAFQNGFQVDSGVNLR
jgi:hypothetical protein